VEYVKFTIFLCPVQSYYEAFHHVASGLVQWVILMFGYTALVKALSLFLQSL
jgi:hypothetical protein